MPVPKGGLWQVHPHAAAHAAAAAVPAVRIDSGMIDLAHFYRAKTALITGGSSGIGLALAELLVGNGADVCILARREETLTAALNQIELKRISSHQRIESLSADVADWQNLNPRLQGLLDRWEKIDLLFNSAGAAHPGEFLDLDLAIFHSMMDINYFGTLHTIKMVLPGMLQRGQGWIINISSTAGYLNIYGYSAYGASKYAVTGLSEALRMELKPKNIQVSVVFPPDTETPQLAYEKQFKPKPSLALSAGGGLLKPGAVAREILIGVYRKKAIILPGFENKAIYFLVNLLGKRFANLFMDRIVANALKHYPSPKK